MAGVHRLNELSHTATLIATVMSVSTLATIVSAVENSKDLSCTEKSMFSHLGDDFYHYRAFGYDQYGCAFTFQCPTDCLCILSDHNMTVDCQSGESFHQVDYPSTFLKTSFLDDTVYSNVADLNSSIESIADNDYNDYGEYNYYHDYGAPNQNLIVWYNAGLTNITPDAFAALNRDVDSIILSRNKIREIQQRQFAGLTYLNGLYLDYNRIAWIRQRSFDGLVSLSFLYLDHNSIVEIHPGSFDGLVNLEYLQLHHNDIVEIHSGSFNGLVNLWTLYLDHNSIVEIQPVTFDGLVNLGYLRLVRNRIVEINPGSLSGLTYLFNLQLEYNRIVTIHPGSFDELVDLWALNLGHNRIVEIHPWLFNGLANLKYLNLDHNSIIEIHLGSFNSLVNLESLFLDHNNIVNIHSGSFDGLNNLETLYLNYNSIVQIHLGSFDGLINLESLLLDHNSIVEIYLGTFDGLVNIGYLWLDHNTIVKIHSGLFDGLVILESLQLHYNSIVEIPLGLFDGLVNVGSLRLDHNRIVKIHAGLFSGLGELKYLQLDHNSIVEIHPESFHGLDNLSYLYLKYNSIVKIHPGSFDGLVSLSDLRLDYNRIVEIHPGSFDGLVSLSDLRLDYNRIVEIHPKSFEGLVNLWSLTLGHNRIVEIHLVLAEGENLDLYQLNLNHNNIGTLDWKVFKDLYSLRKLTLQNNHIAAMHSAHFETLSNLEYLDLSRNNLIMLTLPLTLSKLVYFSLAYNKLSFIPYGTFQHTNNLYYLDLSENSFDHFDSLSYFNNSIGPIEIIDLRKNDLYSVNDNSFIGFGNTTSILVDNEATCCFIQAANCNATIPRSQFLTCGRLLPNLFQRIIMWILGSFSLTSNIAVLLYRYQNRQENTIQVLFISNLSISDMVMGIYMIIVASADLYYKDFFPSEFWRLSPTCKFAGTLSILSSEASVLFVTLISLDRFMGIRYTFSTYRLGSYSSKALVVFLWVIAIVLSVTSAIISDLNSDWYDVSEVCTGLPLSRRNVYENEFEQRTIPIFDFINLESLNINITYDVIINHIPGMYYGIAVFTVLNSICFLIVLICYTGIFITVIQTAKQAGRARNLKEERKMATKMGVIVMTDLACWAPVIILSILVQSGRHIVTPHVYTWIVTFVLPINSAINPFLYTLANLIFDYINHRQNRPHTVHISL